MLLSALTLFWNCYSKFHLCCFLLFLFFLHFLFFSERKKFWYSCSGPFFFFNSQPFAGKAWDIALFLSVLFYRLALSFCLELRWPVFNKGMFILLVFNKMQISLHTTWKALHQPELACCDLWCGTWQDVLLWLCSKERGKIQTLDPVQECNCILIVEKIQVLLIGFRFQFSWYSYWKETYYVFFHIFFFPSGSHTC